jgi:hypothetical protein
MSEFNREDRYVVIKRSDVENYWRADVRKQFMAALGRLNEHHVRIPQRQYLVIESDWPEYEPAWQMIERRMDGQPPVTAAEELDAVLHWRDKHAIAIKERDALQLRLNAADQRIDELERDKARLDALESNCWDVRYDSSPNGDAGDSSISIEIVGHWMDKPTERVIGEDYSENLRAAIDQAMTAPAYPPARPEYPELDENLGLEHQIPGTSGMRLNMLANQGE